MPSSKFPSDIARSRLDKRAKEQLALSNNITPKRLQKSPSQKRSESGRKKYLTRAGRKTEESTKPVAQDCRGCDVETKCMYGNNLEKCHRPKRIEPCPVCKAMIAYRYDYDHEYTGCPVCGRK